VELCFDLTKMQKDGLFISTWQLHDSNRKNFGGEIVFKINFKKTSDISIKPEYVQMGQTEAKAKTVSIEEFRAKYKTKIDNRNDLNNKVSQMREMFDLNAVPDYKLIQALIMTNGDVDCALNNICNSKLNLSAYDEKNLK